jgi:Domain of unknown function DUF29
MPLSDDDFYAWTQHQATLLRAAKWQELDYANLAGEISRAWAGVIAGN